MLSTFKRNIYAFIGSLAVHLFLLSGAFFGETFLAWSSGGELYESFDMTEPVLVPQNNKELLLQDKITFFSGKDFEIILVEDIEESLSQIEQIEVPQLDNAIRNKPKNAPLVKVPAVKPKLQNMTTVPYPAYAGGQTGVVTVCIVVGTDGKPEYISTAASSGNPFIDGAVLEHCKGWRFLPARNEKNQKVRCLTYIAVEVKP